MGVWLSKRSGGAGGGSYTRESPRYLYSWGTTQRELKCCRNQAGHL